MISSPKYEALLIEEQIFQRLYDHWRELENGHFEATITSILKEIERDKEDAMWAFVANAMN